MRKITKTLVLLAAAAMAFASCSKEKETPVPTPEEGTIRVKFAADAALTKVGLTPNDGDTQFSATWNEDDQIEITSFVHGGAMKETLPAEWSSDDKCFTTLFEYEQYAEGLYDFVGVWPVGKDADKLFPAERHQNGSSYNGDYDLMKSSRASAATLTADETIVLDMVRQTSIAYFHITSALNENIVSATLTTDKPIASSNASLTYEGFEPNVETAGVNSIKLNIDGEMSSSDFKLWFNVLPVQYETMSLLIETANHSFTLSKKSSGEWKAGELNKVVLTNVPAEKWAEIERPAGEKTETITMESDNLTSYATEDGNVTVEFAGGNTPLAWNNGIRIYANGTVTVEAKTGYKLKSVVFNSVVNANNKGVKPTPKINDAEVPEDNISWEGEASKVVLKAVGSAGNIATTSITITYTDPNGSSDPIYKYSVMVDKNVTNGTVTVDKTSAKEGDEVTIAATPSDGYELEAGSVKAYNAVSGAELTVTNNKFTMPAANVNVTAAFSLIPTLSATSPEPYASNLTNNSGKGFSIPVTANQAWVAAIKTDDPNAADITLMTSEGEGGENNNLVFSFNSQNTSPLVAKSTVVVLSPKNGNRPEPVEITITHEKRGATLVLNNDDKANVTANVLATETSYTVNITNANFSEWSVLEYKIGDAAQSTTDANCVTTHDDGANTGSVTIGFPANASESNDVTITLKVGYEGIITKTLTLTQAAAAARTPNVTLDFTDNTNWNFPTTKVVTANTYNDGTTTITLAGTSGNGYSFNSQNKYLILGQNGATLTFQSFDFDVDRIKVYGKAGASSSVKQNIYVGDNAVSTETTGAAGTNTYDINANYQASGNIYVLKVTSAANTQITKIEIYGGARKTLTGLVVSGTPTKTTYTEGELFDPAGLTVTATYDDDSEAPFSGAEWEITPNTGLTPGTSSVSVIAKKGDVRSASFTVNGLTVNAIPTFTIQNYTDAKGSVTASVNSSRAGEIITLTISPVSPNTLKAIKVYKAGDASTTVALSGTGDSRTFTMPAYNVVIDATFDAQAEQHLTWGFESTSNVPFDFTSVTNNTTNSNISAHGGSKIGTVGAKSASMTTKNKISNPKSLKCYVGMTSTNTTSSTWKVEYSSDKSSWSSPSNNTKSATSMGKGNWDLFEVSFPSGLGDVYIRISYSSSTTAVRAIDDIDITY